MDRVIGFRKNRGLDRSQSTREQRQPLDRGSYRKMSEGRRAENHGERRTASLQGGLYGRMARVSKTVRLHLPTIWMSWFVHGDSDCESCDPSLALMTNLPQDGIYCHHHYHHLLYRLCLTLSVGQTRSGQTVDDVGNQSGFFRSCQNTVRCVRWKHQE